MKDEIFESAEVVEWLSKYVRSKIDVEGDIEFSFPSTGSQTPVAMIHFNGEPRFVVKLSRRFVNFAKILMNTRRMNSLGLPVPKLICWTFQGWTSPIGSALIVEEFISGEPIYAISDKDRRRQMLSQIASSLAVMHSVRRRNHGLFYLPRPRSYIEFYLPRVLSRVSRTEPFLSQSKAKYLSKMFKAQAEKIGRRSNYELIHGRVNMNNFILTGSVAFIIDLLNVHFGDFPRDLIRAIHRHCNDDGERAHFLEQYFKRVEGVDEGEFKRLDAFYHADYHLRRACTLIRTKNSLNPDPEILHETIVRELDQTFEALGISNRHEIRAG